MLTVIRDNKGLLRFLTTKQFIDYGVLAYNIVHLYMLLQIGVKMLLI